MVAMIALCNDWSEACGSKCSIYLLDRGRIKQAIVSRQKQEYQRQGRDINSSRQESGSNTEIEIRRMGKRSEMSAGARTRLRNVCECEGCLCRAVNEVQV